MKQSRATQKLRRRTMKRTEFITLFTNLCAEGRRQGYPNLTLCETLSFQAADERIAGKLWWRSTFYSLLTSKEWKDILHSMLDLREYNHEPSAVA